MTWQQRCMISDMWRSSCPGLIKCVSWMYFVEFSVLLNEFCFRHCKRLAGFEAVSIQFKYLLLDSYECNSQRKSNNMVCRQPWKEIRRRLHFYEKTLWSELQISSFIKFVFCWTFVNVMYWEYKHFLFLYWPISFIIYTIKVLEFSPKSNHCTT